MEIQPRGTLGRCALCQVCKPVSARLPWRRLAETDRRAPHFPSVCTRSDLRMQISGVFLFVLVSFQANDCVCVKMAQRSKDNSGGGRKKTNKKQLSKMFESGTPVASRCTQEACKCVPASCGESLCSLLLQGSSVTHVGLEAAVGRS